MIVVTGAAHVLDPGVDPRPFMRQPKLKKFMGPQDAMAVVAAASAARVAGLPDALGERAGLYVAVGHLPFEREDIDLLLAGSTVEGPDGPRFDLPSFAEKGYASVNPLVTFRCLSNMPAFHASAALDLQGPYLVTYPGPGQLYAALEQARDDLLDGRVDQALVVGVCHQRNFLVEHHHRRLDPPVEASRLADGAGCLVLETAARGGARARARLESLQLSYAPRHPFEEPAPLAESFEPAVALPGELGPASLPVALSMVLGQALEHRVSARDGHLGASRWAAP